MADTVIAQVILRSPDGSSLLDPDEPITSENVDAHGIGKDVVERAEKTLRDLGFEVLQASEVSLSVSGDKERFEEVFDTTLKVRSKSPGTGEDAAYEATEPVQIPEALSPIVDEVAFPVPPEFH